MSKITDFYQHKTTIEKSGEFSEVSSVQWDALEEKLIREDLMPRLMQRIAPILQEAQSALSININYNPEGTMALTFTRNCMQLTSGNVAVSFPMDNVTETDGNSVADEGDPFESVKAVTDYGSILMEKEVDWSVLNHGFTIPMAYHEAFKRQYANSVIRGHGAEITFILNGTEYPAILREPDMAGGRKVLQILWKGKTLVAALREIFADTYAFMCSSKEQGSGKKQIKLPENLKRKIIICAHEKRGSYIIIPTLGKDRQ